MKLTWGQAVDEIANKIQKQPMEIFDGMPSDLVHRKLTRLVLEEFHDRISEARDPDCEFLTGFMELPGRGNGKTENGS